MMRSGTDNPGPNGGPQDRGLDRGFGDGPPECTRRRFWKMAIGGTAAVSAGAVGYPVVAFLRLPKSLGPVELMEVPLEELKDGQGVWGEHRGRQIVVIKLGDEIRAFDGVCAHLGCIVRWDSASRMFKCPCHDAKYDDLGNPVSGPINAPLRRVEFVIKDGVLKIRDSFGQR